MKNFYKTMLIIILALTGCEDDLNPFEQKEDTLILNCVLKNNVSTQSAFFAKSFFVDNFNPNSNAEDNSISDAEIRIFFNDSVKIFKDSVITRNNEQSSTLTTYVHNNFLTIPNTYYEIEAILKDGRKIFSNTQTPAEVSFNYKSDNLVPPPNKNSVSIYWETKDQQLYTAARFKFVYFKNENGSQVRYEKEVPRAYALDNGEYKAFYPEPSYDNFITVEMNAFNRALEEISEGDPNKENYTILAFILEILVYDRNLTAYYASKTELGEGFSITTNENDYSNIEGGRGIFGSFIQQRKAVKFSIDYIKSFGYLAGLTE